jgi:hypothetical protein
MCNLTHSVPQPPNTNTLATSTGPGGDVTPATFTTPQPDAIKDTKFKKLLKAALPIAQGGLIGGFGGDWRQPGSGMRVAQNFYAQQTDMAMRKQNMERELANQKSLAAQRQENIDLDKAHEARLASQDETDQERLEQGQWRLDASVNPAVEVNARTGEVRRPRIGAQAPTGVPTDPPGSSPAAFPDGSGLSIDEKRRRSAAQIRNGGVPDMPGGTPMGGGWRTPPDVPLVPIGQERAEDAARRLSDEEARRKLPRPRAVTDSDARGVSTTHFVDVNPESDTYMQPVDDGDPAATRYPRPSRSRSQTPDKGKIETYAQSVLEQVGGDANRAVDAVDGLKTMPPGMKAAVRQRIREIKRPGAPARKRTFSTDDMKRLTQPSPQ